MTRFNDPLILYRVEHQDGDPRPANLHNLFSGAACGFLVCGGPSLHGFPYERLGERGVWSMGVNNISGMAPVRAHVSADPPKKFHHGIWLDPAIMKFIPRPKLSARSKGRIRFKTCSPDGGTMFSEPGIVVRECPNVWGFERRSWLKCDETFFTETSAAWGNHDSGVSQTGEKKTVCTMMLAMRLMYYLGFRTIFLLGVDFRMEATHQDNLGGYAFGQARTPDNCLSNREHYVIVNDWLTRLRPVFEQYGLHIYNCNSRSGLRAFDYVSFDDAMAACRGDVPSGPFDLSGWYEK